jgi:hypothetical protein
MAPRKIKIRRCDVYTDEICKLYSSNKTTTFIGDKLGISATSVTNILKKNGICIRRYKYLMNEQYFNSIDCGEKAYFLGLLGADGCVCSTENKIILSLQKSDKYILYKLSKIIQTDRPVIYNKNTQIYSLIIGSKIIKNDLMRLGLMPRKTFAYRFPDFIKQEFMYSFIRGYFDGDGSFGQKKDRPTATKPRGNLSFTGNRVFCEGLKSFLEVDGFNPKMYHNKLTNKNIVEVRLLRKAEIRRLFDLMYDGSGLYLSRKYLKIKGFIDANNI